jgi:hypothetical protein
VGGVGINTGLSVVSEVRIEMGEGIGRGEKGTHGGRGQLGGVSGGAGWAMGSGM